MSTVHAPPLLPLELGPSDLESGAAAPEAPEATDLEGLADYHAAPPLPDTPPLPAVLGAGAGFALLGLCAGLGQLDPATALRTAPTALLIAGGPLVLTTPALLVVHQFADLSSPPEDIVAAVANPVVQAGRLALGLVPTVLFFAATSDLGFTIYMLAVAAIGGRAVCDAGFGLAATERAAGTSLSRQAAMQSIALGWALITVLIGLRIAFDATLFALSG